MQKRSRIWTMPKEQFAKIVAESKSISDILRLLLYTATGSSHKEIQKRCQHEGISLSHIPLGWGSNRGRTFSKHSKAKLEDILIENSTFHRGHLKERLIKDSILENKCFICGMPPVWKDKLLVMILDHINGIPNDNRLENLRLVCPNCNSQLSTFTGRNIYQKSNFRKICPECNGTKNKYSRMCHKCSSKLHRKVSRPSKDMLLKNVGKLGYKGTGEVYGVAGCTIKKWIRQYSKTSNTNNSN